MLWNVPNSLTMLRILLIPVFVGIFYLPATTIPPHWVNFTATLVFALAAITDWFDGYLARVLNQTSAFGAFLDPVADKLMVAAALIVLVELDRAGAIVALVIIGREIAISALREWMAGLGQRSSVAVATLGKVKTAAQMAAILFLLYADPINLAKFVEIPAAFADLAIIDTFFIGSVLIVIAAFLTLLSMAYYLRAAWPNMQSK